MIEPALRATPWALPGAIVVVIVTLVLAPRAARWLRTRPWLAFGIVASAGLVVLVTLSPSVDAGPGRTRFASFELSLDTFRRLDGINESTLNVALFVPLAAFVAMAGVNAVRRLTIPAVILLPVAVELIQYAFPSLGRSGFQMDDVVANLTGVLVGLAGGAAARFVITRASGADLPLASEPAEASAEI